MQIIENIYIKYWGQDNLNPFPSCGKHGLRLSAFYAYQ